MAQLAAFQPRPAAELRTFAESEAVAGAHLVRKVRWHTGLNQAAFADAYRIDLDHLRELELGRTQPDRALVAYLSVIDHAPHVVAQALGG